VRFGNWELIRANQLDNLITWLVRLAQAAILLGLLAAYFHFVFKQFPWTQGLAQTFEGYLVETLQAGWQAFVGYLPSLLTIALVVVVTRFLLNLFKPFFQELSAGSFSLPGFYSEWADATHKLVSFLIIALAAVIIFPLLPGFQSPAFQGISVFLGLLISLGSTSVIANLVSGSILIYTRAFRIGDRIKIGDISGKVLETTLLVTRILTPTNVIVSIPNSQISTSSIENFSFSYRELNQPLILRTSVYLGYEVSWREAYQAMGQAALLTHGIAKSPEPFVLQGELNEVYVTYLLNAYIDVEYFKDKTLKELEEARSQLHENIRDCCTAAGIRIFAPNYEADPTNYGPAANN
jgi:small-conductance mechanosensitive channel